MVRHLIQGQHELFPLIRPRQLQLLLHIIRCYEAWLADKGLRLLQPSRARFQHLTSLHMIKPSAEHSLLEDHESWFLLLDLSEGARAGRSVVRLGLDTVLQLALLDEKWVLSIAECVITRNALRCLAVVLANAGILAEIDGKLIIVGVEVLFNLRPITLSYTQSKLKAVNKPFEEALIVSHWTEVLIDTTMKKERRWMAGTDS